MNRPPLKIYFTVDTEASIAGAFAEPNKKKPQISALVDGMVGNKSEALGFLLRTLQQYQLRATFFTESLQSRYFGNEPMKQRASQIVEAGQDLQLHLHPCWLSYTDGRLNETKPNDASTGRSQSELNDIFTEAVDRFSQWGFGKPVAVRTGNFSAGLDTFLACKHAGIFYSSNIAEPLHPNLPTELKIHYGFHSISDVTELPLTSFWSYSLNGQPKRRIMAITACSYQEMKSTLLQAWEQGLDAVCILTHPFEFVKIKNDQTGICARNHVNQNRFVALCKFIAERPEKFKCSVFGDLPLDKPLITLHEPVLKNSYSKMLARTIQNGLNDAFF